MDIMWLIDFPTLVLIIIGGLDLGVLGFFGFDVATAVFGPHARIAYMAVGVSAVWHFCVRDSIERIFREICEHSTISLSSFTNCRRTVRCGPSKRDFARLAS